MKAKLIIFLPLFASPLFAKEALFESAWSKAYENGLALKASNEAVTASDINSKRASNHWYPTVYATGSSFVTNDPGANMFGLLSERSITQADFSPDKLNHPSSNLFNKGALGLNISLYEGGMKSAINRASNMQLESKKSENDSLVRAFYSEFAKNYFLISSLLIQEKELNKVKNNLEEILSKYQIGNKGNMLGYSGLLGLKSLKNRLGAFLDENNAKIKAYKKVITELSGNEIAPVLMTRENLYSNLNEYLPTSQNEYQQTANIKSLEYNSKAAEEIIGAEKSRNLPRVGVFAEGNVFNGDRKTATGYATGLYLNWNLFSGNDLGASEQAIHNSKAASYFAKASSQKEKMEFDSLVQMEETLTKTLGTLEDSQKLLDEQSGVANSLFKNGMINALQLVEVISRRVDLLNSKTEIESKLIETKARKLTLTNNKPSILN